MRILLSSLITLIFCGSSDAFAQAKKIDCSKLEFSISLPFQECMFEPSTTKRIDAYVGRGHDASSSYNVGMYFAGSGSIGWSSPNLLLEGESKAKEGPMTYYDPLPNIYKEFFAQTPPRSSRFQEGAWLRFDATVLRPDGSAKMNRLQFSKTALTSKWIVFGSLCVKDGQVPTNAADLVLQSLQIKSQ